MAVALLSSSSGNGVQTRSTEADVQQQIDGLRDFIQEHSR